MSTQVDTGQSRSGSAPPIPIRNLYVMMAYAFKAMSSRDLTSVGQEEFEHLHDFLGEILLRGVASQVKRGLYRSYTAVGEELTTVRGRIDLARTARIRAVRPSVIHCGFDEYTVDTPHNRVLKCVIVLLIRRGQLSAPRRDALRRLLPYLDAVTLIAPNEVQFQALTFHRLNASYRMLIGVAELIIKGMLPNQQDTGTPLEDWIQDEAMSRLYERFLLEYFRFHHPQLHPRACQIPWATGEANGDLQHLAEEEPKPRTFGEGQLPIMRTDVTLTGPDRTLIIDAKYYSRNLQDSGYGKRTVHSGNLYQLFTYVMNQQAREDALEHNGIVKQGRKPVSGLLLYAGTAAAEQPHLRTTIAGHTIEATALDLGQPWDMVKRKLHSIGKNAGQKHQ